MVKLEDIQEVITSAINDYYGVDNKCSIIKSSPFYKQALEMSEKYGLRLKKCTPDQLRFEDTGHINPLNDRITSTELRFDEMVRENGMTQFHIDFTNSPREDDHEKGIYTLDELLGYYDSMPQNLKNGVGLINFINSDESNRSTIYDPNLRRENVVYITNDAYVGKTEYESDAHNPERVMAHEMGHCLEMGQLNSKEKSFIKKIFARDPSTNTEEGNRYFEEVILPKLHMYSSSDGVFGEAVQREANREGRDLSGVIPSTYASSYYMMHSDDETVRLSEHFAETVSIVSFRDKADRSNALVKTGNPLLVSLLGLGRDMDFDEYVGSGKQVDSIPVVEDLLFD